MISFQPISIAQLLYDHVYDHRPHSDGVVLNPFFARHWC